VAIKTKPPEFEVLAQVGVDGLISAPAAYDWLACQLVPPALNLGFEPEYGRFKQPFAPGLIVPLEQVV
jgi:hypothetical protein